MSFQTATAAWIVWRPTNLSPPAGQEKIFWIEEKKIFVILQNTFKDYQQAPSVTTGKVPTEDGGEHHE